MSARTVTIDAATRDRLLADGNGAVDVTDEAGVVIGRFYRSGPPAPPPGYVIEGEWPSEEEIERRMQEGAWHPAPAVEAFLAGLKRGTR